MGKINEYRVNSGNRDLFINGRMYYKQCGTAVRQLQQTVTGDQMLRQLPSPHITKDWDSSHLATNNSENQYA